jgi:hypothetical protein
MVVLMGIAVDFGIYQLFIKIKFFENSQPYFGGFGLIEHLKVRIYGEKL